MKSQNERKFEEPRISVEWVRFKHDPAANLAEAIKRPTLFGIYGGKETGKSSLAEALASKYSKVIDLFGSRDNESLGWLRSRFKDSALLLTGPSVKVKSPWDTCDVDKLSLTKMKDYDVIISASALYGNIREEWVGLTKVLERLWHRTHHKDPWCLTIREAANLLYARIAIGESQTQAKNSAIYVFREMRHCGFALAVDSIRWFSIDIDIRSLADYTFLKAQGIEGLPDNLKFLYQYFEPYSVMRMRRERFIVMSRYGPLGHGSFTCPFWHKEEEEDLLHDLNIEVEYGELPDLGERGHVGDFEHARIVNVRLNAPKGQRSADKIGEQLGRSSRTIQKVMTYHNLMIESVGECDKCRRVKSASSKKRIEAEDLKV